ncbi:MAG: hypothetical protein EPO02_10665 [Nitrospirae bacterium]|nr:MAG: hypothetical protein EPO02_10665 [Nitrospirota bacterium]
MVLTDKEELRYNNVIRHTISDDMEILEIDTPKEVIIIPMRQVKYMACDAGIFQQTKAAEKKGDAKPEGQKW